VRGHVLVLVPKPTGSGLMPIPSQPLGRWQAEPLSGPGLVLPLTCSVSLGDSLL
jgi:hypothetical protein